MNIKRRVVLISAELSTLSSFDNQDRIESLRILLTNKGYKFTSVLGSYKNKLERSFLIDASEDIVKSLQDVANYYKQDSILVVNEDQKATLLFGSGQKQTIGTMQRVESIEGLDGWTFVNGEYFSVKN